MKFTCRYCDFSKEVADDYAGKTVKCPECKSSVKIPEPGRGEKNRFSIEEFVEKTTRKDKNEGLFELESNNILEVNVDGMVWTKMGSMIAITTHHDPLTLKTRRGRPVVTDPNATVAWSGNLAPDLKTDISLKTFFGRGSGESIQMEFNGDGFVVVQPYEEIYFQSR